MAEIPETSAMPWWVRAITVFGVPAAIAMYLVWALVSGQTTALAQISATLQAQKTSISEVAALTARMESYLRLLCVNTSKTQAERNSCLTVR